MKRKLKELLEQHNLDEKNLTELIERDNQVRGIMLNYHEKTVNGNSIITMNRAIYQLSKLYENPFK